MNKLRSQIAFIFLILLIFTSCKSSKIEKENLQYTGAAQQNNDVEIISEQELLTEIERIVHKALSEQMNISQKETEYDTEKPVDILTGKPPVKKEKEILFQKKTDEITNAKGQSKTVQQDFKQTNEKSKFEIEFIKSKTTESETNTQKESEIFLKWVGGITIILAILSLILYILYKYLKKRLHNPL